MKYYNAPIINYADRAEAELVRIEFFDIEIDSLRSFDCETQMSIEKINEAKILPVKVQNSRESMLSYLNDDYIIFADEPARMSESAKAVEWELSENIKIPENAIVINCTSIGLKDEDLPILDFSKVPQSAVFFDMPYRRGEQTNSVKSATKYGIKAQSGLSMLAWQGAKSLSIWTNHNFEDIAKTMYTTLGL